VRRFLSVEGPHVRLPAVGSAFIVSVATFSYPIYSLKSWVQNTVPLAGIPIGDNCIEILQAGVEVEQPESLACLYPCKWRT
jgi:hypothetical protein